MKPLCKTHLGLRSRSTLKASGQQVTQQQGSDISQQPPPGLKLLPVLWIYKLKLGAKGKVERHKARLVVKGCAQREGIDYNEVYAPVAKHTTMRALLAKAVAEGLHVHQLDVKTAFLNGDLEEDIWMQQPPGFSVDGGLACHLKKSLYGLKQAPRAWNKRLTEELESQSFVVSDSDPCLFCSSAI